jgi:hypothetical protein
MAEGATVLSNIDIYAAAGADTAYDRTFPVTVSDGTLNLTFSASVENAKINAIKVVSASGPIACSQYTPSSTIPTGYASPYDVVSSPSTNLMNVTCDVSSARVDLSKGDPPAVYLQPRLPVQDGRNELDSRTLHEHRIPYRQCLVSQDRQHHDIPDQHGTYQPELLAGLHLLMGGKCMEMRVQGLGVYAELLADSEF